jgi:SAM-dependent methyltransferase
MYARQQERVKSGCNYYAELDGLLTSTDGSIHSKARSTAIGVNEVRKWAKTLSRGSSVIDLGCGPGYPITVVLVEEGLQLFGVDAAPSFVAAFRRNLPGTPVVCESALELRLFDRTFDAVLSIGADGPSQGRRAASPHPEVLADTRSRLSPAIYCNRQTCRLD